MKMSERVVLAELLANQQRMMARISELEAAAVPPSPTPDREMEAYLAYLAKETLRGNRWVVRRHNEYAARFLSAGRDFPVPRYPFEPPAQITH